MSEPKTADEKVADYILDLLHGDAGELDGPDHLRHCPDARVAFSEARDGGYGCDTGCEYVRLAARIECPHGGPGAFDYGQFGDLASIIEAMDQPSVTRPEATRVLIPLSDEECAPPGQVATHLTFVNESPSSGVVGLDIRAAEGGEWIPFMAPTAIGSAQWLSVDLPSGVVGLRSVRSGGVSASVIWVSQLER